ncbi:extracellular solute-binding protein [Paenibacillus nasutitermitis]|uniref:ABC transporter substrate-binding protein n=1 Tax=Paenibacillus nasutitermitis TaxID=1652958 RepID=A0A917DYU1_9BACL|nr:extracellular solute-binding protein [Paenibacillus nasutitermitis]GGD79837.1 ABC transporter substrate-binding protein [Paenibacillus nasutitermitis]
MSDKGLKRNRTALIWLAGGIICLLIFFGVSGLNKRSSADVASRAIGPVTDGIPVAEVSEQQKTYYSYVLGEWRKQGFTDAMQTITVPGGQISNQSEGADTTVGPYKGMNQALIWNNDSTNWVEYDIEVEQAGLYELELEYHANEAEDKDDRLHSAVLAVSIDGDFPFREARAVELPWKFRDQLPLRTNADGNQLQPGQVGVEEWQRVPFQDAEGRYAVPFRWHLTEGAHTIRLQGVDSMIIGKLRLQPPTQIAAYKDVAAGYPKTPSPARDIIEIEAEQLLEKNAMAIQIQSERDALMSPPAKGKNIFNAVGGYALEEGRQTVVWKFKVPRSGIYQIVLRAYQGYTASQASFRTVYIDGKVPFEELLAYRVPYADEWARTALESSPDQPYPFYLEAGEHTLALEATIAPLHEALVLQEDILRKLNEVSYDLNALVGGVVDRNRTWDIKNGFPELLSALQSVSGQMRMMADELLAANGGQTNENVQNVRTSIKNMESLLKYPNEIPHKLDQLGNIREKVASAQRSMLSSPLLIDKIYIAPLDAQLPRMKANFFEKARTTTARFLGSFASGNRISQVGDGVVDVWMQYGRDNVSVLQEMADESFTPMTGIKVKINQLAKEEVLVMANAAGNVPDAALGITSAQPIQMALRGAAADLSKFAGFDELVQSFAPGSMQPYYYDGGYYAFPETLNFKMLYYRKDILQRLGAEVPETWQDVIRLLPTLQQSNYNFFVPHEYESFAFQYGAEFWRQGRLESALESPAGLQSFKLMTDLYRKYGIEKQVSSFYQHFRDGTIPVGVSDFQTYLQLSIGAPELIGMWDVAPVPGVRQEDGQIVRWSGGAQLSALIMKDSADKEEAWKFLQWWLSADTQAQFGMRMESYYGPAFRWNTANAEGFARLPWRKEELDAFLEQWQWYTTMMHVPGSYFVEREMNNAWNRAVVGGVNDRESFRMAIDNINREVRRKSIEFGLMDEQGKVIHSIKLPQISKPWKEVLDYGGK